MSAYRKAIATFFGSLATWGGTAAADGRIDMVEWFGIAGVIAATVLVWGVQNEPVE